MNKKLDLAKLDENTYQRNGKIGQALLSWLPVVVVSFVLVSFIGTTALMLFCAKMIGVNELPGWTILISFCAVGLAMKVLYKVVSYFEMFQKLSTDECKEVADLIKNIEKCGKYRDMVLAIPRSLRKLDLMVMNEYEKNEIHKEREALKVILHDMKPLFGLRLNSPQKTI